MISYGDMLDVVEKAEVKNAPPTPPPPLVETPKETTTKKEDNEDNIEDVIDLKKEDEK